MTPDELLDGLRAGDRHEGGIRCLRLHRVEPTALAAIRREVAQLCRTNRPSDVTRPEHVTSWVHPFGTVVQYSLLNSSGRPDDFSEDHDLDRGTKRFHAAADAPELARLVALFPDAVNVRVNVLGATSGLAAHEEHAFVRIPGGPVAARVRLHLPLETGPAAVLVLDGQVYRLAEGVVHLVNHGCVHAARNGGPAPRVHLVWDVVLTGAAYELLFADGTAPDPLRRITGAERAVVPLRTERVAGARRLPSVLSRAETDTARLVDSQSSTPWKSAST